jgi:hypothetical protein
VRSTITAAIAASLLMLAIAAPALAGQPQVEVLVECTVDGVDDSTTFTGSKGQVRLQTLAWSRTVDCDKGSLVTTIQ